MDSAFFSKKPETNYFPSDVLKFIKQNATPRQMFKSMKVCKYFQHKNFPFLPVPNPGTIKFNYNYNVHPKKYWITDEAPLRYNRDLSRFIPKIAYCDITRLKSINQKITFKDFKFLTAAGNIRELDLENFNIFKENGDKVSLEEILTCIPNVEVINWSSDVASFILKENAKKINLPKLKIFKLHINPECFDLTIFHSFMIKHNHTKFNIQTGLPQQQIQRSRRM